MKQTMKRLLSLHLAAVLLLLMAGTAGTSAQTRQQFTVTGFGIDQFDLTAQNEQYKKIDGSGSLYAIIKVTSTNPDDDLREYRFNFGNMNHEVTEHDGKLWVYVQRNAKYVTISRPGYATVERYDLQTTIEAGRTYTMQLSTAPKQICTQMVMFAVKPADSRATVIVKSSAAGAIDDVVGITDERGFAAKPLPFGSYSYRVVAEGFYPTEGHFTLGDMSQTHEEQLTLKPRFATITLRVDADADIYVNGELKGRRTWTGRMNSGSCQVECRQANHRNSSQAITIQDNESRTIDLPLPIPITGMLSVMSQPLGATITIDGQPQGNTPKQFPQMLIGSHTIELAIQGYENVVQQFVVNDGETTSLNIALKKGMSPQPVSSGDDQVFTLTNKSKTVTFRMKPVGAGSFDMGSNSGDNDEKPVHRVTLTNDYYIGETEVTQELWYSVMGSNPSNFKGDKRPVETVSWNDCQTFIEKLNSLTAGKRPAGRSFRLPTEAEWEYAARGGSKSRGYTYAGSNDLDAVGWYWENSGRSRLSGEWDWDKIKNNNCQTHDVAGKAANELGLYDMSGNVFEWCQDWYGDYPSSSQTNPTGTSSGYSRVTRGGSWNHRAEFCRSAYRRDFGPSDGRNRLGLRLAL